MERSDLTATSYLAGRAVAGGLAVVGVWFLARPSGLGWDALAAGLGGDVELVAVGVGVVLLVLAGLTVKLHSLRVATAELVEGLNQLLYGRDYARDREAIEILVAAMESDDTERRAAAHAHLVRLTGHDLAPDPHVWRTWWTANQRHFSRNRADRDTASAGAPDAGDPGGRAP